MATTREFYRTGRGPTPADEDLWCLVYDDSAKRVFVRHEWRAARHNGVEDFEIQAFLEQTGDAPMALVKALFEGPASA